MKLDFVYLCEGSSDGPLLRHLETLCIRAGADEVQGLAPDFSLVAERVGADVRSKIKAMLQLGPCPDLLFIHRDADRAGREARVQEIKDALRDLPVPVWVPVIPVRMIEAWVLADEAAIRRIAENPAGREDLGLPALRAIEATADAKGRLEQALLQATAAKGRRLKQFKRDFSRHRAQLLEALDLDGPVSQLPAWQQLCADIDQAVAALKDRRTR